MKSIAEVDQLMNGQRGSGDQFSLDRIKYLLDEMGNPEASLRFVHLSGTNGKGSTSTFIESVVRHSGYKTGIFNSPQLTRINEVMRVNNQPISDQELLDLANRVYQKALDLEKEMDQAFYPFELQVATMLTYFKEEAVDLVVLEAGLGGRYDATNVVENTLVGVVTRLGLDHTAVLGDSLEAIAYHKAGIAKAGAPLLTYPAEPSVEKVFAEVCQSKQATWQPVSFDSLELRSSSLQGQVFDYKELKNVHIQLLGSHQVKNAALAIEALRILKDRGFDQIQEASLRQGLQAAKIPGRLEVISQQPLVILDGAHNPQGVKSLRTNLDQLFPDQKLNFLMGALKDKAYDHMVEIMEDKASHFYFMKPENESRALEPQDLLDLIEGKPIPARVLASFDELLDLLLQAGADDVFVIYGSFYLVGPLRRQLLEKI